MGLDRSQYIVDGFAFIEGINRTINKTDDVVFVAGSGDDSAAVIMSDQNDQSGWAPIRRMVLSVSFSGDSSEFSTARIL